MTVARLSDATLNAAAPGVIVPAYDRSAVTIGVLHLGPGAFARGHQFHYFDQLLARDPRWGVSAVSLRSPGARDALRPQDGLYAVAELDARPKLRIIGAVRELLVAPQDPQAVFARLASPDLRLVTMTVTEKGYCLDAGGWLDLSHPDIVHDLAQPAVPRSLIGWLVEGSARRRAAGLGGLAIVCCDNLPDNGVKLRAATLALAQHRDAGLADWIEQACVFPRTMVDSITPATDDALRARVEAQLGLHDAWPIQREAFVQWVVEDILPPGGPDLTGVGVELTDDVAGYEQAKLRLLNGPHSALAYMGLLRGHDAVRDAMADPELAAFLRQLMVEDIAPTLKPPAGLDLDRYIEAVLKRFSNPAIRHALAQIAWDGSKKLLYRLLDTLAGARAAGRPVERLCVPVAAWMRFIVRQAQAGVQIVDPLADELARIGQGCTGEASHDVARFVALEAVFTSALAADSAVRTALEAAYAAA